MDEEKAIINGASDAAETTVPAPEADIRELIKKNLELTEEILVMTKKIRSFVFWERIFGILKLLVIVVPLVLGLIYLPALLQNAFAPYQELLNMNQQAGSQLNSLDLNNLPQSLKNLIK